jgi:tetratricopeptide (TPR) repeat protein
MRSVRSRPLHLRALHVRVLCALALAAPLLGAPTLARADDPGAAEVLFENARKLMDKGDRAQACPMFNESYRLDPAPGTLLNIAECHRLDGKTATAWGEFVAAAREFRRRNDERRAGFADERAKKLEPELAYVRFAMDTPPEGLALERDGVSGTRDSLGLKLPIDPGAHSVTVTATGKKPATVTFEAKPKATVDVTLPPLEDAPPEPTRLDVADRGLHPRAVAGFVVGGGGLALAAVGGVMGVLTAVEKGELDASCNERPDGTKFGCDAGLLDQATLYANLSNVFLAAGAVAFGTGLVLVLTAPEGGPEGEPAAGEPAEPEPSVSLRFGPNAVSATVRW